jgi:hypothetical protein
MRSFFRLVFKSSDPIFCLLSLTPPPLHIVDLYVISNKRLSILLPSLLPNPHQQQNRSPLFLSGAASCLLVSSRAPRFFFLSFYPSPFPLFLLLPFFPFIILFLYLTQQSSYHPDVGVFHVQQRRKYNQLWLF